MPNIVGIKVFILGPDNGFVNISAKLSLDAMYIKCKNLL